MTAKHHAPQPKRRRSTDDLEKRVRRIERNYQRDIAKAVEHAYEAGRREERVVTAIRQALEKSPISPFREPPVGPVPWVEAEPVVLELTIQPSSEPEGPRAQKET